MKLKASVSTKFSGEVSNYRIGDAVEVTDIYGDECTVQDERGYRCVVSVPLRFLDFSGLARATFEAGRSALDGGREP